MEKEEKGGKEVGAAVSSTVNGVIVRINELLYTKLDCQEGIFLLFWGRKKQYPLFLRILRARKVFQIMVGVGGEIKREALLLRPLSNVQWAPAMCRSLSWAEEKPHPCHGLGIYVWGEVTVTSWLLPSSLDNVSVSLTHSCKFVKFISGILLSIPPLLLSSLCGHKVLLLWLPPGSFHFIFSPWVYYS